MKSGTGFEPGEVLLVPFPFTDLSRKKRRPVLVLSEAGHHRASRDFVCCGVTSKPSNRGNSVLLDQSGMVEGGLPLKSRIKYDKVFTLEKTLVVKPFGKVSQEKLMEARKGLAEVLGLKLAAISAVTSLDRAADSAAETA